MRNLLLCVSLFLGVFITGCNESQLTASQKRELQSRDLQGVFENAYKATLQVLQDYGYVIKNSDYASGVLQGETGAKKDKNYFWNGLMLSTEVTATLEQFGPNTVKERLSVIKKWTYVAYGGNVKSETVFDPQLYQKIYDEIQKEMFIRQNINK